jgi:hypothetical protein
VLDINYWIQLGSDTASPRRPGTVVYLSFLLFNISLANVLEINGDFVGWATHMYLALHSAPLAELVHPAHLLPTLDRLACTPFVVPQQTIPHYPPPLSLWPFSSIVEPSQ